MTLSIAHRFVSTEPDPGDPSKLQPSDWGSINTTLPTHVLSGILPAANVDLSGVVAATRTVNGHPLSADVVVTKADLGLTAVENQALSTWSGSLNLTTLGGSPAVDGVPFHTRVNLAGFILDVNTDNQNANFSFNELVAPFQPTTGLGGVGHDNLFIGLHTGTLCTTGCGNLAIGHSALASIVSGIRNVTIGWDSHLHQVSGSWNVTVGVDSMRAGLGSNNVAVGDQAGLENSGSSNVIVGSSAMAAVAASVYNVAVGQYACFLSTTNRNTGIGYSALSTQVTGADNTALGFQAGKSALGSTNVFLGFNAGNRETGSNKLYIDNNGGTSEANGRVQALIYGVFDAVVANQTLAFNAAVTVAGNVTVPTGVLFQGGDFGLAATLVDGLVLHNLTPATAAIPVQQPARLRFRGRAWNSTTLLSETNDFWWESTPVSSGVPSGLFKLGSSINGGAATYPFTVTNFGSVSCSGVTTTAPIVLNGAGSNGELRFSNLAYISSAVYGKMLLTNGNRDTGLSFDVSVDAVLKLRDRSASADASLTALNLTASGAILALNLTVTNPISGSVTGSSASTTGNAATATALQTGRAINGVTFDGTAAITVPAAAGTLTGATLAAGVLASSLTSLGILTAVAIAGITTMGGALALATTTTDGLVLQNTTPATAAIPVQITPRLRFRGQVWNTTSVASNTDDWWIESVPISQATPGSQLKFFRSANGAGGSQPLVIDGFGSVTAGSTITAGAGAFLRWASSSILSAAVSGQMNLSPSANTLGVGLDFLTDAVLKVRTRAQTGDASLTALNITASGAMVNRTKAGTPVDGDVTGPVDGMMVVDTTASKIWVRVGGTWKGVVVA